MLILITGGSSCGKSAFAEKLAIQMKEKARGGSDGQTEPGLIYVATMEPFSEDAKEKIRHHHELRAGKGFVTLEQYTDMEKVIPRLKDFSDTDRNMPGAGSSPLAEKKNLKSEAIFDTGMENRKNDDCSGREKPVVLLECLSNLLANEMFAPHVTEAMRARPEFEEEMCRKICDGIRTLEQAASCLIVVSCNVSEDGASYAWETVKYIHILEQIQVRLARPAAQVYEVVCGIPVALKHMDGKISG